MAARFCELSQAAVQGMKESMIKASSLDYAAINHIAEDVQTRVMNSDDSKEGGKSFLEKRKADWH
ncbi:MAG: 1,4-dihydroxy-2-naphthoyl-CoA synthase [Candidatus Azotimanducaceae bacterium]|jgi:1,4-dihydroxy-2-naphthoyl-CoA synthase